MPAPNEGQQQVQKHENAPKSGEQQVTEPLPLDSDGQSKAGIEEVLKRLDAMEKQQQGVEHLVNKFKQEQGDFRKGQTAIQDLLQNPPANGDTGGDLGEYVTTKQLENLFKSNNEQLVSSLLGAVSNTTAQTELATKYGLDDDGLAEVAAFSEKNGIGNLKAAYLLMNEDQLDPNAQKAKKLLNEKKNKGDIVPEAGDADGKKDTPGSLLKQGKYTEFHAWAKANPNSYRRWQAQKSGVK